MKDIPKISMKLNNAAHKAGWTVRFCESDRQQRLSPSPFLLVLFSQEQRQRGTQSRRKICDRENRKAFLQLAPSLFENVIVPAAGRRQQNRGYARTRTSCPLGSSKIDSSMPHGMEPAIFFPWPGCRCSEFRGNPAAS